MLAHACGAGMTMNVALSRSRVVSIHPIGEINAVRVTYEKLNRTEVGQVPG